MKILVVEDEIRLANAIKKGLELEKYIVDVTYDGDSGYDFAGTDEYDVIILDWMLPNKNGPQICQLLRQNQISTPILMLTAKTQTQDKVQGLDSGADDYLSKPFEFEELLARLRALIRRPPQVDHPILEYQGLTLDASTANVTRAGKLISLTSKEFALLEYLIRHPGKVLSKDHLVSHVWDYDADILPNTVEVYIKNLRQKIDHPFPNLPNLIQTVRGFGYKLS